MPSPSDVLPSDAIRAVFNTRDVNIPVFYNLGVVSLEFGSLFPTETRAQDQRCSKPHQHTVLRHPSRTSHHVSASSPPTRVLRSFLCVTSPCQMLGAPRSAERPGSSSASRPARRTFYLMPLWTDSSVDTKQHTGASHLL